MKKLLLFTFMASLAWTNISHAKFACQPDFKLKGLTKNLKSTINKTPTKFSNDCKPIKKSHGFLFGKKQISNNKFVDQKDSLRKNFKMEVDGNEIRLDGTGRVGMGRNDNPAHLIDNAKTYIKTLKAMERKKLLSGQVKVAPWSDDYWAIAKGILAYRYADKKVRDKTDEVDDHGSMDDIWKVLFDFMQTKSLLPGYYVLNHNIDVLSPSEKYDLLVGDKDYSLTKYMWEEGRSYYERYKKVESWMGICHGWAPAAYMLPRPTKSVTVTAVDGVTKIKFTPADIKALGSQLWAAGQADTKFIGGRCNAKAPRADENGRFLDPDCLDTNAGTWHLSVVNQIGIAKRSMVMDATFDYEVWNHPITSYNYRYFNPITEQYVDTLAEAQVLRADFKKDKFKKYREKGTKYIAGIVMEVKYVVETRPEAIDFDHEGRDAHHTVHYTYDLELSDRGSIIGGEWYLNRHPDFLWTPPKRTKAMSMYDDYLEGEWDPARQAFPKEWARFAPQIKEIDSRGQVNYYTGASERGQPFGKAVRALFKYASKKSGGTLRRGLSGQE